MTTFELTTPKHLGRTVVLGYCDIAAAGIRVLEGMSSASGMHEVGRESLAFSGMGGAVFDGLPAVEAVHFDGEEDAGDDGSKQSVTLLKINTVVGQDLSASLSLSIVDQLAARRSSLDRIIVAAAVQPPKRHQIPSVANAPHSTTSTAAPAVFPPGVVCAFSCEGYRGGGGASPGPPLPPAAVGLPALPAGARISDSFMTTLVRLCRLEGLPLLMLARLGYRATGAAADVDGTDEAINGLGQCIAQVVGLEFNAERACGVRRSKGWKGTAPARAIVPGYI